MGPGPLRRAANPAHEERFVLGEGPRWDRAGDRLLWVDIQAGAVLEGSLDDLALEIRARHHVAPTVGAVTAVADGGLLVAAHQQLVSLSPDAGKTASPVLISPTRRFNDGAVDPGGRFLVGTLALEESRFTEVLMRLEHDGTLNVLDDDLGLSNGLAWSVDGSRLFSIDTLRHAVFVRDYDPASRDVGPRELWLAVEDGYPDGIAVDQEDHVWVAVWGVGEVRRYSPAGALVSVVAVPAPHTSAVALAGPEMDVLVITTATSELTEPQLAAFPDAGRIFTVRVDVPGLPPMAWQPCSLPTSPLTTQDGVHL